MDTNFARTHQETISASRSKERLHDRRHAHGDAFETSSDALETLGRLRAYSPGQTLYQQGGHCQGIFFIKSGLIGLRRLDENGDSALVCIGRRGEILANRAFLAKDVHCSTAEVLTPCVACFMEASQLHAVLERKPALREVLVQEALADLMRSQAKCAALLTEGLQSRLVKLLMALHADYAVAQNGRRLIVDVPIQRKDMAALIGAAPESLSRLLNQLTQQGLIRIEGRRIDFTAAARDLPQAQTVPSMANSRARVDALSILMEARHALLAMIDATDSATRDALNAQVQTASRHLDELLVQLKGADARGAARFNVVWKQFKKTRQRQVIPAILSGHVDVARNIACGIQAERIAQMKDILARTSQMAHSTHLGISFSPA